MPNENLLRLISSGSQRNAYDTNRLQQQMDNERLRQQELGAAAAVKDREAKKKANSPWRKIVSTLGTIGGGVGGALLGGPMGAFMGLQAGNMLGRGLGSTGLPEGYQLGQGFGDTLAQAGSPILQMLAMKQLLTGENPWEKFFGRGGGGFNLSLGGGGGSGNSYGLDLGNFDLGSAPSSLSDVSSSFDLELPEFDV